MPPPDDGGTGLALAAEAARALGYEAGLEAAEAVLRAGLAEGRRRGCSEEALSADPGYREKVTGTVLGPVALRRAWYHCSRCAHGLAPRDAELSLTEGSEQGGCRASSSGCSLPVAA